eukprot:Hpha_TRINITY_DN16598_c1_g6::TRINITY_DN16598_c1_g6_i1::g.132910::m.132910
MDGKESKVFQPLRYGLEPKQQQEDMTNALDDWFQENAAKELHTDPQVSEKLADCAASVVSYEAVCATQEAGGSRVWRLEVCGRIEAGPRFRGTFQLEPDGQDGTVWLVKKEALSRSE